MKSIDFIKKYKLPHRKITVLNINNQKIPFGEYNNMKVEDMKLNKGEFLNYSQIIKKIIFYKLYLANPSSFPQYNFSPSTIEGFKQTLRTIGDIKNIKRENVLNCFSVYLRHCDYSVIDIDDLRYLENKDILPGKLKDELKECIYDLSLRKKLPHYWVKLDNMPDWLKCGKNEVECFKDIKADILNKSRNIWISKDAQFLGNEIKTIDYKDIQDLINEPEDIKKFVKSLKDVKSKKNKDGNYYSKFNGEWVPSSTKDPLKFYISCIPNTPECKQSYNLWFKIGSIIYNLKGDIKIWIDWTNGCGYKWKEQDLSFYWSIFKSNKGRKAGIGSLIKIAKHYVPDCKNIITQRNLNINDLITDGFDNVEIYNEKYVRPCPLDKYNYWFEKSIMGSGKTTTIKNFLKQNDKEYSKVLFFSPRILFSNNLIGDLKDIGFKNYKNQKRIDVINRLIVSLESLYKVGKNKYDMLIIDEVETILNIFSSPTNREVSLNIEVFERLIKETPKICFLDAFLSTKTLNFFKNIGLDQSKAIIRVNKKEYIKKVSYELPINKFSNQIMKKIKQRKKIVIFSFTASYANSIFNTLKAYNEGRKHKIRIKYYYGGMPEKGEYGGKKDLLDVNKNWKSTDVLIYTPTITVGVNFDKFNVFDSLFIYGHCQSCCVRDGFQASLRVRHLKSNELYYNLEGAKINFSGKYTVDTKETINNNIKTKGLKALEMVENYQKENKTDLIEFVDMPKWLLNVLVDAEYEVQQSRVHFIPVFKKYLEELNYQDIKNEELLNEGPEKEEETPEKNEEFNLMDALYPDGHFEVVEDISYDKFKDLELKFKAGNLDNRQVNIYKKYVLKNYLMKGFNTEVQEYYYNHYYINKHNQDEFIDIFLRYNKKKYNIINIVNRVGYGELMENKHIFMGNVRNLLSFLDIKEFEPSKKSKLSSEFVEKNKKELKKLINGCFIEKVINEKNEKANRTYFNKIKKVLKDYYGMTIKTGSRSSKKTKDKVIKNTKYEVLKDEKIHKYDLTMKKEAIGDIFIED